MSIEERLIEALSDKSSMTVKKISNRTLVPISVVRTILQELIEDNQVVRYPSNSKRYKKGREMQGRTLYTLSRQVLHPLCKEDKMYPYCDKCKLASRYKAKCLAGDTCLNQTGGGEWWCSNCPNKWSNIKRF